MGLQRELKTLDYNSSMNSLGVMGHRSQPRRPEPPLRPLPSARSGSRVDWSQFSWQVTSKKLKLLSLGDPVFPSPKYAPSQCMGVSERHAPTGPGLSRGKAAGPGFPSGLPCPLHSALPSPGVLS